MVDWRALRGCERVSDSMKPRSRPVDELGADASPGTVQAVQRSLRLLLVLAEAPRPRTLQELSAIMDCSVSTVRRMLSTLSDVHLVEKEPTRGSLVKSYRLFSYDLIPMDQMERNESRKAPWYQDPTLRTPEAVVAAGLGGRSHPENRYIHGPTDLHTQQVDGASGAVGEESGSWRTRGEDRASQG